MNKNWHAENFKYNESVQYEDARGGFVWFNDFMPDEMKPVEYGPLFAYMYRRFGITGYGSDCHKSIADWYISTPETDVALRVSPKPSGINHSFGYVINRSIFNNSRCEKQQKIVQKALITSMLDLLIPVFVRDVPINALGKMKNYDYDSEECAPWAWAGYGVSLEYFEKKFKG